MAFPWSLLRDAPLASGNIVEDMRLGVDLAVAGHPPRFEPNAVVGGELPSGDGAARAQRTRWEHGHLQTIAQVPRLLRAAFRRRQPRLLALALELAVPPLSILALIWLAALIFSGIGVAAATSPGPLVALTAAGTAAIIAMFAAWVRFGRSVVSAADLLAAPWYALGKVPIYASFLIRRQTVWVRTPRTPPPLEEAR